MQVALGLAAVTVLMLLGIATPCLADSPFDGTPSDPRWSFARSEVSFAPRGETDGSFRSVKLVRRDDGGKQLRIELDTPDGVRKRRIRFSIDPVSLTYTARQHTVEHVTGPRVAASAVTITCRRREISYVTEDPIQINVVKTALWVEWSYNNQVNRIASVSGAGRCTGGRSLALTNWFVAGCRGGTPTVLDAVRAKQSIVADYYNYDFQDNSLITRAWHTIDINVTANAGVPVIVDNYSGEYAHFLNGEIEDDIDQSWDCSPTFEPTAACDTVPYDPEYPDRSTKCYSPLLLDMNGDGIRTVSTNEPVLFDLDADGVQEWVSWSDAAGDEAFLYHDVDDDGAVDGGDELFGTFTRLPDGTRAANGFEALRVHDRNGDGMISPADAVWGKLRLWIDRDHNGIVDARENGSVGAHGVTSISLAYDSLGAAQQYGVDANGNHHVYRGTFTRRLNGVERTFAIDDVFFHAQ